MKKQLLLWFIVLAIVVGITACQISPNTPEPTPMPDEIDTLIELSPTALPTPTSNLAQQAVQYISTRYGIPQEHLLIANEHDRAYPSLGRKFRAFIILDMRTSESPEYALLIDLATREVEEDWNGIEAAAKAAAQAKYGKLEPALYNRLQEIDDDAVLEVVVSPAPNEQLSSQERRMLLMTWLRGQGFVGEPFGKPSVIATLPKQTILELAKHDDVAHIFLMNDLVATATAQLPPIPADCVPVAWRKDTSNLDPPEELSFESLGVFGNYQLWDKRESGLLILTAAKQITDVTQFMQNVPKSALNQVDFDTHFVIITFLGSQTSSDYTGFQVECMVRRNHQVALYAQSGSLPTGPRNAEMGSPYHLIKIQKGDDWAGEFTFELYFDAGEQVAASVTSHIQY